MLLCKINDHQELHFVQATDADELFALTEANRAYLRNWLPESELMPLATPTVRLREQTWGCRRRWRPARQVPEATSGKTVAGLATVKRLTGFSRSHLKNGKSLANALLLRYNQ